MNGPTKAKPMHTPGPWRVVPSSLGGDYIETDGLDADGYPRLIKCPGSGGAVSYSTKICEMNWSGTLEWESNTSLIAAAPETAASHDRLLVALLKVMNRIMAGSICTDIGEDEKWNNAISEARAAIAAARPKP